MTIAGELGVLFESWNSQVELAVMVEYFREKVQVFDVIGGAVVNVECFWW